MRGYQITWSNKRILMERSLMKKMLLDKLVSN